MKRFALTLVAASVLLFDVEGVQERVSLRGTFTIDKRTADQWEKLFNPIKTKMTPVDQMQVFGNPNYKGNLHFARQHYLGTTNRDFALKKLKTIGAKYGLSLASGGKQMQTQMSQNKENIKPNVAGVKKTIVKPALTKPLVPIKTSTRGPAYPLYQGKSSGPKYPLHQVKSSGPTHPLVQQYVKGIDTVNRLNDQNLKAFKELNAAEARQQRKLDDLQAVFDRPTGDIDYGAADTVVAEVGAKRKEDAKFDADIEARLRALRDQPETTPTDEEIWQRLKRLRS